MNETIVWEHSTGHVLWPFYGTPYLYFSARLAPIDLSPVRLLKNLRISVVNQFKMQREPKRALLQTRAVKIRRGRA